MKENKFFRKLKYFFKRNSYAIAVSVCVLLVLTLVSVTALSFVNDGEGNKTIEEVPNVPTGSEEVVVFTSPIEGGTITKEYAEDFLLEDSTTGIWQTHQALDYSASDGTKVLAVYDGEVESIEN